MAKKASYTVEGLPPYHSNLNPIELVWSSVKGYVARNNKTFRMKEVRQLLDTALTQVTAEMWQSDISYVVKEEERMWELDNLTGVMADRMVINVGADSDLDGVTALPASDTDSD